MNLTEQQLESFKEKYANVIVNNMTLKECQELIFNQKCNDFDDMSFDEIVEESDRHLIDSLEHKFYNMKSGNHQTKVTTIGG